MALVLDMNSAREGSLRGGVQCSLLRREGSGLERNSKCAQGFAAQTELELNTTSLKKKCSSVTSFARAYIHIYVHMYTTRRRRFLQCSTPPSLSLRIPSVINNHHSGPTKPV